MPPAALAMAIGHPQWIGIDPKSDRTAQAAAAVFGRLHDTASRSAFQSNTRPSSASSPRPINSMASTILPPLPNMASAKPTMRKLGEANGDRERSSRASARSSSLGLSRHMAVNADAVDRLM